MPGKRILSGERPTGAASCRQQYHQASCHPPPIFSEVPTVHPARPSGQAASLDSHVVDQLVVQQERPILQAVWGWLWIPLRQNGLEAGPKRMSQHPKLSGAHVRANAASPVWGPLWAWALLAPCARSGAASGDWGPGRSFWWLLWAEARESAVGVGCSATQPNVRLDLSLALCRARRRMC